MSRLFLNIHEHVIILINIRIYNYMQRVSVSIHEYSIIFRFMNINVFAANIHAYSCVFNQFSRAWINMVCKLSNQTSDAFVKSIECVCLQVVHYIDHIGKYIFRAFCEMSSWFKPICHRDFPSACGVWKTLLNNGHHNDWKELLGAWRHAHYLLRRCGREFCDKLA